MSWFGNWFAWTEIEVLNLIADIKKGVAIAEADIIKANAWIIAEAPTIAADVQAVLTIVEELGTAGIVLNPQMAAAIAAVNVTNAALQAYAQAATHGNNTAGALIAGYTAAKQASEAHSKAAIAVASLPPAPSTTPAS